MKTQEIITQLRTLLNGFNAFSPVLPQEDMNCVSLNIISGEQALNLCGTGEYNFSFAVTVRGYKEDDSLTRGLCDDVYDALHLKTTTNVISIIGDMPNYIGIDGYGRYNYSIVFNAIAKGE